MWREPQRSLKLLETKIIDNERRECVQNLISEMKYREERQMEIEDDILNEIDGLLRRIEHG